MTPPTDKTRRPRPLPWWGLFVLLPGLAGSGFVLVMAGGEVLAAAYWGSGMLWGLAALLMLGVTFYLSRLSSPAWGLVAVGIVCTVVLIGSQVVYLDNAQYRLHRAVEEAEPGRFPGAWNGLDRQEQYRRWMANVLDQPDASGWWAHLRSNAAVGARRMDLAFEYKPGESGYRAIHRQGWVVWLNWAASLLFVGAGCIMSLIGCAVWGERTTAT